MYPRIYVSSYVKGPIRPPKNGEQQLSRWAFRISDPALCQRLRGSHPIVGGGHSAFYQLEAIQPTHIRVGDLLLVDEGQVIYADGVIRQGAALIDESAVTGDSTQVLRESGGRDQVLRDALVVSGSIVVEVTPRLGHSLDWIGFDQAKVREEVIQNVGKDVLARNADCPPTIDDCIATDRPFSRDAERSVHCSFNVSTRPKKS